MKKFLTKKNIIIAFVLVVIILLITVPIITSKNANSALNNVVTSTLSKSKITESISVTGTIESAHSENVYTTSSYPIKQVLAHLGEKVKSGDVLGRLDTSTLSLDLAQARLSDAYAEASAKLALDSSTSAYESAMISYDSGEISKSDLQRAKNDLDSAQINYENKSQQITVQKLEKQMNDSVLRSPIDGEVTLVNATVGSMGQGVLFVVEDVNNLEITTGIKEFDIAKVKVGQKVTIKTDATGDKVMNGTIKSINAAAEKGTNGTTVSSSDVKFETKISVTDKDPNLKIGMNARLNIIIQEKSNVYSVPYEAVLQNDAGKDIIYVAEKKAVGYVVKEYPITKGLETDFKIEISGDGLLDGLLVISDPTKLKSGDEIKLKEASVKTN